MSAPVFISHSSKDREAAETICAELESRKLECWIAARDVQPGENFQEAIVRAIRVAKVMVLIFTKHANNSDEIKKEVALASQHQLVVIPVRLDDVVPNDALAYALATRHWIDLFRDWKQAIDRLSTRIAAIVSIETTEDGKTLTRSSDQSGLQSAKRVEPELQRSGQAPHLATPANRSQHPAERGEPLPASGTRLRRRGFGLMGNILVGVLGALIGMFLAQSLGIASMGSGASLIIALLGAILLLVTAGCFRRG
jgi:uncharacterized membrane protein YeaQ/YmgE (transglycosylase-associated protein family)